MNTTYYRNVRSFSSHQPRFNIQSISTQLKKIENDYQYLLNMCKRNKKTNTKKQYTYDFQNISHIQQVSSPNQKTHGQSRYSISGLSIARLSPKKNDSYIYEDNISPRNSPQKIRNQSKFEQKEVNNLMKQVERQFARFDYLLRQTHYQGDKYLNSQRMNRFSQYIEKNDRNVPIINISSKQYQQKTKAYSFGNINQLSLQSYSKNSSLEKIKGKQQENQNKDKYDTYYLDKYVPHTKLQIIKESNKEENITPLKLNDNISKNKSQTEKMPSSNFKYDHADIKFGQKHNIYSNINQIDEQMKQSIYKYALQQRQIQKNNSPKQEIKRQMLQQSNITVKKTIQPIIYSPYQHLIKKQQKQQFKPQIKNPIKSLHMVNKQMQKLQEDNFRYSKEKPQKIKQKFDLHLDLDLINLHNQQFKNIQTQEKQKSKKNQFQKQSFISRQKQSKIKKSQFQKRSFISTQKQSINKKSQFQKRSFISTQKQSINKKSQFQKRSFISTQKQSKNTNKMNLNNQNNRTKNINNPIQISYQDSKKIQTITKEPISKKNIQNINYFQSKTIDNLRVKKQDFMSMDSEFEKHFYQTQKNIQQGFKRITKKNFDISTKKNYSTEKKPQKQSVNKFQNQNLRTFDNHTYIWKEAQEQLKKKIQHTHKKQIHQYYHPILFSQLHDFYQKESGKTKKSVKAQEQYINQIKKTFYIDDQFKPTSFSLFNNINKPKYLWNQIQWRPIKQIYPEYKIQIINQNKSYFKIQYGLLQASYLYQTMSYLTHSKHIKSIIEKETQEKYKVLLYKNGQQFQIVVDSFFPVIKKNNKWLNAFVQPHRNQMMKEVYIWPLLIQKALAKMYSTYQSLQSESNLLGDSFKELTGGTFIQYNLKDKKKLVNILQKQQLVYAYINNQGYEFLLEIIQKQNQFYFKFAGNCNKQEIFKKSKLNLDKLNMKDSSSLILQFNQLQGYIKSVIRFNQFVVLYDIKPAIQRIKSMESRQTVRQFQLKHSSTCLIDLTQTDLRFSRNKSKLGLLRMIICQQNKGYIDSFFAKKKTGTIKIHLEPGNYKIYINCNWEGKKLCDITLCVYSQYFLDIFQQHYDQPIIEKIMKKISSNKKSNQLNLTKIFLLKGGMLLQKYQNPHSAINFQRDLTNIKQQIEVMNHPNKKVFKEQVAEKDTKILRIRLYKTEMDDYKVNVRNAHFTQSQNIYILPDKMINLFE